jgi:hypothetical protein
MNLNPIKQNMNEIVIGEKRVLFSYKTAVACYTNDNTVHITSKKWSRTTTKHINAWIAGFQFDLKVQEHPQEWFDNLLNEVK